MPWIISPIPVDMIETDRKPPKKGMNSLLAHLQSGGSVPPIHIKIHFGLHPFKICDGRHRLYAAKLLGWKLINARWKGRME